VSQLERQFARRFSDQDWDLSGFRPGGSHQGNRRENRQEGEIAMCRALSCLAFEEARRAEGSTDNTSLRDRGPLYDDDLSAADLSAAERFLGDADAAEALTPFVLTSQSA
jgi:hypothetical protein